jgi:anti-sigma B factor antagonist
MDVPTICSGFERIGGAGVVTIGGEVDLGSVGKVAPHVNAAIRSDAATIVVDLTATTFMDSTGLAVILRLLRTVEHRGRRLVVACPPGDVRMAFAATRIDRILDLFDTRAAALDATG